MQRSETGAVKAYLLYLGLHAVLTAIVFAVGRGLRRGIGADSAARRVHGRYVFWWAVGAFAIGGPLGPLVVGADTNEGAIGFAMFCLLGGWLVGTLHGAAVLVGRWLARASRGSTDAGSRDKPDRDPDGVPE